MLGFFAVSKKAYFCFLYSDFKLHFNHFAIKLDLYYKVKYPENITKIREP